MTENLFVPSSNHLPMALILFVIQLIIVGVPIFLIIKFARRNIREKQKFRLEMGKLADEVQQLKSKIELSQKSK